MLHFKINVDELKPYYFIPEILMEKSVRQNEAPKAQLQPILTRRKNGEHKKCVDHGSQPADIQEAIKSWLFSLALG